MRGNSRKAGARSGCGSRGNSCSRYRPDARCGAGRIRPGLCAGGYRADAYRRWASHPRAGRLVSVLPGLPSLLPEPAPTDAGIRVVGQCTAVPALKRGLAAAWTIRPPKSALADPAEAAERPTWARCHVCQTTRNVRFWDCAMGCSMTWVDSCRNASRSRCPLQHRAKSNIFLSSVLSTGYSRTGMARPAAPPTSCLPGATSTRPRWPKHAIRHIPVGLQAANLW
jgi:hypothetical protein